MALRKSSYKAGDEVDAKCLASCGKNLVLGHVVVAMVGDKIVKVKCNTCEKEHSYRAPDSPSEATARRRRAERKASAKDANALPSASDYEGLVKGHDLSKAEKYSPKMALDTHSVIDHPKFGLGLVTDLKEGNKAQVAFPDGGKILVYGR